jgi:ATP diphosphatase
MAALREETESLSRATDEEEAAIGAILFAAVGAARKLGVDAETALRRTTRGFAVRYERFLADRQEGGDDPASISEDEIRELFLGSRRR